MNTEIICITTVLFALLCCVFILIDCNCVNQSPITMGNFDVNAIHTNYDLKEEINLINCQYVVPGDNNTDLQSSSPTDLNVLQLNIRGLLNNQDQLVTLLHEHKVDIALLCETWLNSNTEKLIKIPNYKIHTSNRIDEIGGGVCILSSNKLRSRIHLDLKVETTLLEHCIVELKTDTRNILLVSGYRPPNCNVRIFLKEYNTLLKHLKMNKHHELIIGMDHNLDLLKANEFLESNLKRSLIPCISKPTRITHKMASQIDNIMASPKAYCNHVPYILVDEISDHMPVVVKFRNQNKSMKGQRTVIHRKLDSQALEKIGQDINVTNWPELLLELDANNSFNLFHEKLIASIDTHAPEKTLRLGRKTLIRDPWITTGILRSLKRQKHLYKEMLQSKTNVSTYRYKSYRNCLQKIIRGNRQYYLHEKCKEFRQNGRKLWQLINKILGKENNKQNTIESLKVDNILKYDSESITNSFNEFFSTVGENLAKQQICDPPELREYLKSLKQQESSMFLHPTT